MRSINMRQRLKKLFPVGSPLWHSYFLVKRSYLALSDPASLKEVRWHVVNQNILLEQYKAIYIPIPKVACSTLKSICAELLGMKTPDNDIAEEIHLLQFPCVKKYRIKNYYSDYFKFAFVRNPWARIVSCYNDKINFDQGHVYFRYENSFISYLKKKKMFSENMSFDRFVEVICDIPDEYAQAHFRSQHKFLADEQMKIIVDYIGRFENIANDFQDISDRLGIRVRLPHIRRGKTKRYKDYYNIRTALMVEKRYEKDIEMFGYKY